MSKGKFDFVLNFPINFPLHRKFMLRTIARTSSPTSQSTTLRKQRGNRDFRSLLSPSLRHCAQSSEGKIPFSTKILETEPAFIQLADI